MRVNKILNTNGTSLWARKEKRKVRVTTIKCRILKDKKHSWGELKVYFDQETWKTNGDGLIYTDKLFETELQAYLTTRDFSEKAVEEVNYSEQGMQSENYVSLDVGSAFVKEWMKKYPKGLIEHF